MKTLGLFFKKQYAAEEKIQRLLRKLEDMMNGKTYGRVIINVNE